MEAESKETLHVLRALELRIKLATLPERHGLVSSAKDAVAEEERMNKAVWANVTLTAASSAAAPAPCGTAAEAGLLLAVAALGIGANTLLMAMVAVRRRGWAQGLLFHQGLIDCTRAVLLLPLGAAPLLLCPPRLPSWSPRCSLLEAAFLLLATVSTVNQLTWLLSDGAPSAPACLAFAIFLVWFSSTTIQLGPTFLAGATAALLCPPRQNVLPPRTLAPVRHHVLGALWVGVNSLCLLLAALHLRKMHKDLCRSKLETARVASLVTAMMLSSAADTDHVQSYVEQREQRGLRRLHMFWVLLAAYLVFWGPLYCVALVRPNTLLPQQVALHVAFLHAAVNPALVLVLDTDLRPPRRSTVVSCVAHDTPRAPMFTRLETAL
ncbi:uncharacterized protein LOC135387641 [Ornithodoros turicata]|uniref:uncharacterized protein LOC135387641 n=1 Tax=Ornithodoros turicata TaxID=34597 RepID=UPI003139D6E7